MHDRTTTASGASPGEAEDLARGRSGTAGSPPPARVRDVLEQIVAVEAEARRLVAQAQDRGAQAVAAARRQAHELALSTAEQAGREAEELLVAARAGAARERTRKLETARAEIEKRLRLDGEALRRASDLVVRGVLGRRGDEP